MRGNQKGSESLDQNVSFLDAFPNAEIVCSMLTNILQKPLGAVAVLAAAIGGPYAAFETETGSSLRKTFLGNQGPSGNQPQGLPPTDSYSLNLLQGSNGFPSTSDGGTLSPNSASMPTFPNQPGFSANPINASVLPSHQPYAGVTGASRPLYQNGIGQVPGGPLQSNQGHHVVYGEATITPLGPTASTSNLYGTAGSQLTSYPQNPHNIETRQGPAQVVPGGTNQLWNYTLGVPSLQQMQYQPTQVGGGEVHDLREVLRFDITPVWLTQRFSRVTTVLSNVQLDGMRVPLITGTRPTDLAGTLTYYFDGRQTLRRINLHGLMGDPTQLQMLLVQYYGFQPEQTLGGQLFTTRWNNRVSNVLHLSPAPIIYSGADHSKFIVFLELNQAGDNFGISPEASELLRNLQENRRW